MTINISMVKENTSPHRPLGRKAKTLNFRHQGGTHCRCPYCITPYNRAHAKLEVMEEINSFYKEVPS